MIAAVAFGMVSLYSCGGTTEEATTDETKTEETVTEETTTPEAETTTDVEANQTTAQ